MAVNAINLGQSTQNFLTFPKDIYILGIYNFWGYNICRGPRCDPKKIRLVCEKVVTHILERVTGKTKHSNDTINDVFILDIDVIKSSYSLVKLFASISVKKFVRPCQTVKT